MTKHEKLSALLSIVEYIGKEIKSPFRMERGWTRDVDSLLQRACEYCISIE